MDQHERNRLQTQNIEAAIAADNPGFEVDLCELRRLLGRLLARKMDERERIRLRDVLKAEIQRGGLRA